MLCTTTSTPREETMDGIIATHASEIATTGPRIFEIATTRGTLRAMTRLSPNELRTLPSTAIVSGGYDPLHGGHLDNMYGAAAYGPVVAIVNNDDFLRKKRAADALCPGPCQDESTRLYLVSTLEPVAVAVLSIDHDMTVNETLRALWTAELTQPRWFCNGGNRSHGPIPEADTCQALGLTLVTNCGGAKSDASSRIIRRIAAQGALTATRGERKRWGAHTQVDMDEHSTKKVLLFTGETPGVSLQTHERRAETWQVLSGQGFLMLGLVDTSGEQVYRRGRPVYGETKTLTPRDTYTILRGQAHMGCAHGTEPLVIYETWHGNDTSEEDIQRYGDPFCNPNDRVLCYDWLRDLEQYR